MCTSCRAVGVSFELLDCWYLVAEVTLLNLTKFVNVLWPLLFKLFIIYSVVSFRGMKGLLVALESMLVGSDVRGC